MTPLLIDRLKAANARIEIVDREAMFVMFSDDTILPITAKFDRYGRETDDNEAVQMIEFGSDETGWGELNLDYVIWEELQ